MTIQDSAEKQTKENKGLPVLFTLAGTLFLLLSICGQFLINASRWAALSAAVCALLFMIPLRHQSGCLLFPLLAAGNLPACFLGTWTACTGAALLNLGAGAVLLLQSRRARQGGKGILRRLLAFLPPLVLLPASALLTFVTFFSAPAMRLLRSAAFPAENVSDAQQTEALLDNGVRVVRDIQYDSGLPNGFLDLYYPAKLENQKPLTVLYIHGGGYIWGDKAGGDPNAGSTSFEGSLVYQLAAAGYPVVSLNYALAPEYPYPNAIRQLSRGLHWLREHGEELNLPLEGVAFAGGSAGGNLAGVLANLQTNPAYAAQMNLEPAFSPGEVKAAVFEGGLLDNRGFGVTHSLFFDYLFFHMGRVYLQTNELRGNQALAPSNVIDNVTGDFPPTFLSDGNTGTFYDQARAMEARLSELGVPVKLNIFPREEAGPLGHGFEESGSPWGLKTIQMILAFLEEVT